MTINKLILVGAVAAGVVLPGLVRAADLEINVGDRPYRTHGDRYWEGDYEMIWVPGHMSHGHWVHGHYRRGEHRRHHDDHGDHHDEGDHR